ncbi:MAG: hypothetical protein PHY99_03730 [Bacteroidales bacterium]|nr:hypothetical protein [Bacteroidales bacterium]
MRKLKISGIILLSVFLVSCHHKGNVNSSGQSGSVKPTTADSIPPQNADSLADATRPDDEIGNLIWDYDINTERIVQTAKVDQDTLTQEKLIGMINSAYHNKVLLDFLKISHDTIFIRIKDPEYLTQQMGTSGAFKFMVSVTFTLTELRGIEYVSFDFEEGDHASPGTYSRKYYQDWVKEDRKINQKTIS